MSLVPRSICPAFRHALRLALAAAVAAVVSTATCGCWSVVEVEDLAHVVALGFDEVPGERDKVEFYAQLLNPVSSAYGAAVEGGGGGGGAGGTSMDRSLGRPYVVTRIEALTVFEAARKLDTLTTRRLHGGHAVIVVFSERFARRGVEPTLDVLLRHHQLRRSIRIMVTPDPVAEVMQTPAALTAIPALGVAGLLTEQSSVSLAWAMSIGDFLCALDEGPACDPLAGWITVGAGRASVVPPTPTIRVEGTAAFVGDRYAGHLCAHETRGVLWVTGKVRGSIVSMECPEAGPGVFGLEVFGQRTKLSHSYRNGLLTITAEARVNADIGEVRGRAELRSPKVLDALARAGARSVEAEMARAVRRLQALGSDAVHFGAYIQRSDRALWKKLSPDWRNEFRKVRFVPRARFTIRGVGLVLGR